MRRGWNPCGRAHANDVQSGAQPVFRLQTSCCTGNFSALHSRFSGSSARQGRHTSVVCREARTSPSPWRSIRGCSSHPGPIPVSWFWMDTGMAPAHDIARFKRLRHCCAPVAPYKTERGRMPRSVSFIVSRPVPVPGKTTAPPAPPRSSIRLKSSLPRSAQSPDKSRSANRRSTPESRSTSLAGSFPTTR